jgi:DNA-binding helix-hairpin-helix protein with protein kinase domain
MITAPSLGTVREASARLENEIPEMSRALESLHEVEAQAERLRDEVIDKAAGVLRASDDVIEQIRALPDELSADREALLVHTREVRRQAFDRMRELNPDQIWFWTEEWQAGEREADRQIAAGETIRFESGEALEAAFAEIDAELEHSAHV